MKSVHSSTRRNDLGLCTWKSTRTTNTVPVANPSPAWPTKRRPIRSPCPIPWEAWTLTTTQPPPAWIHFLGSLPPSTPPSRRRSTRHPPRQPTAWALPRQSPRLLRLRPLRSTWTRADCLASLRPTDLIISTITEWRDFRACPAWPASADFPIWTAATAAATGCRPTAIHLWAEWTDSAKDRRRQWLRPPRRPEATAASWARRTESRSSNSRPPLSTHRSCTPRRAPQLPPLTTRPPPRPPLLECNTPWLQPAILLWINWPDCGGPCPFSTNNNNLSIDISLQFFSFFLAFVVFGDNIFWTNLYNCKKSSKKRKFGAWS